MQFKYTGSEAIEMIKNYYPNDWDNKLNRCQKTLQSMAQRHHITITEVYTKYIAPVALQSEGILFFAALSQLINPSEIANIERKKRILELEEQRNKVSEQLFSIENNTGISHEDKKTIRGYYVQLQQDTTRQITELLNAFTVVEPLLVIHQNGLFG